ncbi:22977_t:CDS:2 [Cetraspora pellucida]|uniref:22977_t:CDS:1 n=1 Tax=Cetraspora pellucida TaxID=1433469 RepID=A0A9N9K1A1_9GLOM|nr:22977_t:CDS:2 [Cetraspora pellucida]
MDTGIIASFKLYYRYMQLQHAVDRDEAGKRDIYKVNQLQLCIKVISLYDKNGVSIIPSSDESIEDIKENLLVDPNDELVVKKLQQQINALDVHNPMPVEDLLNIKEEQEAVTKIEQKENEIVIPPLTREEQLRILHNVLRIVDERIDNSGVTIKSLCKLQFCIYKEVQKEKAKKQVQLRLD